MGSTYQKKRETKITNFNGKSKHFRSNWEKSREITSDDITHLRQFQTNNAEMQRTDKSREEILSAVRFVWFFWIFTAVVWFFCICLKIGLNLSEPVWILVRICLILSDFVKPLFLLGFRLVCICLIIFSEFWSDFVSICLNLSN